MSVILSELAQDAERSVLGAMLIDPNAVGPLLHQLSDSDFVDERYRGIFLAIRKLQGQGAVPDALTVNAALGGGFREILAEILTVTPTAANAGEYAGICHKTAQQWHLAQLGEELAGAAGLEDALAVVARINAITCEKPGLRITGLKQAYEDFLDRHESGKAPPYLTWGIRELDENTYVEPGDFLVLGGYPSAGKTALALQVCFHIAKSKRVGYFYYENNDKKLFDRLVALNAKVSFGKIKRHDLDTEDFEKIVDVQDLLTAPSLEFVDASGMTAGDLRAVALSRRYEVAAVDYLQKIPGEHGRKPLNDFERVSAVSSALQDLGKQTGVTVLALSQLTRPDKGRESAPDMHAFRQSGQIEQDADVALLLYRDPDGDYDTRRVLKIGKNKEGRANRVLRMYFDGDTQTFSRFHPAEEVRPKKKKKRGGQLDFWSDWEEVPPEKDEPFPNEDQDQ